MALNDQQVVAALPAGPKWIRAGQEEWIDERVVGGSLEEQKGDRMGSLASQVDAFLSTA
jgi:hypothetical protein